MGVVVTNPLQCSEERDVVARRQLHSRGIAKGVIQLNIQTRDVDNRARGNCQVVGHSPRNYTEEKTAELLAESRSLHKYRSSPD